MGGLSLPGLGGVLFPDPLSQFQFWSVPISMLHPGGSRVSNVHCRVAIQPRGAKDVLPDGRRAVARARRPSDDAFLHLAATAIPARLAHIWFSAPPLGRLALHRHRNGLDLPA